jgi:DNA repair protein RecO (recombination protein O)
VNEIHDDAVVLRTFKSGEADRVVVLWTRHFGKVRVLAKGARKTTSRLGATLETLAYVKVDLVQTRGEFYIARHVAHTERLSTLRGSYSRISAGYAVVEAIDAIPSDGVADEAIFDLLTRVLLTLDDVVLLSTLGSRRL